MRRRCFFTSLFIFSRRTIFNFKKDRHFLKGFFVRNPIPKSIAQTIRHRTRPEHFCATIHSHFLLIFSVFGVLNVLKRFFRSAIRNDYQTYCCGHSQFTWSITVNHGQSKSIKVNQIISSMYLCATDTFMNVLRTIPQNKKTGKTLNKNTIKHKQPNK